MAIRENPSRVSENDRTGQKRDVPHLTPEPPGLIKKIGESKVGRAAGAFTLTAAIAGAGIVATGGGEDRGSVERVMKAPGNEVNLVLRAIDIPDQAPIIKLEAKTTQTPEVQGLLGRMRTFLEAHHPEALTETPTSISVLDTGTSRVNVVFFGEGFQLIPTAAANSLALARELGGASGDNRYAYSSKGRNSEFAFHDRDPGDESWLFIEPPQVPFPGQTEGARNGDPTTVHVGDTSDGSRFTILRSSIDFRTAAPFQGGLNPLLLQALLPHALNVVPSDSSSNPELVAQVFQNLSVLFDDRTHGDSTYHPPASHYVDFPGWVPPKGLVDALPGGMGKALPKLVALQK